MPATFAVAPDGTRIAYDAAGSGPALVLLHGGWGNRRDWYDTGYVARLQDRYRVIAIDLRGHGESDQLTDPVAYTTTRMSEDILAIADACGADRFALWGYSLGANIGRYLAAQSPRVTRCALIGIPFGAAAKGNFRQMILDLRAHWVPLLAAMQAGTLDPAHLAPEDQATWARRPVPVGLAWLSAMLDWPDLAPADLRCPTLWLVGSQNDRALESVRETEGALPGTHVQVQIIPGLNHQQEFSEIDQVFPALLAFTQREA